jgi:hypothetical protein
MQGKLGFRFHFEIQNWNLLYWALKQGNPTFLQFRLYKFYHLYLSNRNSTFMPYGFNTDRNLFVEGRAAWYMRFAEFPAIQDKLA